MPSEKDRAIDKGNMRTKFCEDQTCSFGDMFANRQTDAVITIFCFPYWGGEVKMLYKHTMDRILSNVIK